MASLLGAAVAQPGSDFGLLGDGDDDELFQFINPEMTAEQFMSGLAPLDPSDLDASPLEYLSPSTGSEWAKSPGRQSQNNSHAAQSSSLSPGTLVLTPTSTLPEFRDARDAVLFEDPEASDHTSTSPESSFSSSDDYVHVDHSASGQPRGIGGRDVSMVDRPPPAINSGAPSSSAPQSQGFTALNNNNFGYGQSHSFVSTSAAGGWMDSSGPGQWGDFDPSNFYLDSSTFAPVASDDNDLLSSIHAYDQTNTPRTFDSALPFRPVTSGEHGFTQDSDEQYYALQALQSAPSFIPTTSGAPFQLSHQHTTHGSHFLPSQAQQQVQTLPSQWRHQHHSRPAPYDTRIPPTVQGHSHSTGVSIPSSPAHAPRPPVHHAHQAPVIHQSQPIVPSNVHSQQQNPVPVTVVRSSRQLQPAVPGSSRAGASASRQQPARRGGRKKGSTLAQGTREKSGKMRKTVACWRCAMQRDPVR